MFFKDYDLEANINILVNTQTNENEFFVKFNKIANYNIKILNWVINGYKIMQLDGLFENFKKACSEEIVKFIESVNDDIYISINEKEDIIKKEMLNLFERYLYKNEINLEKEYKKVEKLYDEINNIKIHYFHMLSERALEIVEIDIKNGYFFVLMTKDSIIKINKHSEDIDDIVKPISKLFMLKDITLHYIENVDLNNLSKEFFTDSIRNILKKDGSAIFLYQLKNKKPKLKHIINFSMNK